MVQHIQERIMQKYIKLVMKIVVIVALSPIMVLGYIFGLSIAGFITGKLLLDNTIEWIDNE